MLTEGAEVIAQTYENDSASRQVPPVSVSVTLGTSDTESPTTADDGPMVMPVTEGGALPQVETVTSSVLSALVSSRESVASGTFFYFFFSLFAVDAKPAWRFAWSFLDCVLAASF